MNARRSGVGDLVQDLCSLQRDRLSMNPENEMNVRSMNVAVQPSVAKACATQIQIDSVYAGWGRSEGVRSIKGGGNVETLVCDTAGRTVPRGNRLT